MNNLFNIHTPQKEKENILSLFRISLNYFAHDSENLNIESNIQNEDTPSVKKSSPKRYSGRNFSLF